MKNLVALMPMVLFFGGALGGGCSGSDAPPTDTAAAALATDNGLSVNGLSVNGLSVNGLSANGTSYNGLATQGLTNSALKSSQFQSWFLGQSGGTAYTNMVMHYAVKCAVASNDSRSVTINGQTYSWAGLLGLAPQWAGGQAIPLIEQQLVSACLAAHVNKFGLNVGVSILGYTENGTSIPIGPTELSTYSTTEGCFFGNLFNGDGAFVGAQQSWSSAYSSSRACAIRALSSGDAYCAPMATIGYCKNFCVPDITGTAYTSCTYNSITYPPITTRITPDQIYLCGDGICQISELCGIALNRDNCSDCGPCP